MEEGKTGGGLERRGSKRKEGRGRGIKREGERARSRETKREGERGVGRGGREGERGQPLQAEVAVGLAWFLHRRRTERRRRRAEEGEAAAGAGQEPAGQRRHPDDPAGHAVRERARE